MTILTKELLEKYTGLATFFDFYKFLQFAGKSELPTLSMAAPSTDLPTIQVDMQSVKAQAFDELYARIPHANSIEVIHQMVADFPREANQIHSFLNNLPTRK